MALLTLSSTHPTPAQQMRSIRPTTRKPASSLQSLASLAVIASIAWPSSSVSAALAPYPVGGFAMCQTGSSLHIQGGVSYSLSATYLVTTNQHFRLDLSQSFDSAPSSTKPPVWANLTSDYSPFQRFHAGACTPDQASFLTVGNADAMNTGAGGSGFMMAYSVAKGTWTPVTQAVSGATNSNNQNSQKAGGGGLMAAGRTMPGFAVGGATKSLGVVIGGGWLPQKSNTASAMGTDLTNLVTEADLIAFGSDGSLSSLNWSVAPAGGNGGSNINQNLGPVAGSKVVPLSSPGGKAVVLGGVTGSRGNGNGLSFANLSIVDMVTGAVVIQVGTETEFVHECQQPKYDEHD
ncbi:hypothetical protein BC939DRAFT_252791 [Gamsiella multidivaricata]|uniref:uncharacterized protein n=1 Tax=Gamsiella multidivaricata TaxID=101098 RepID=UPI00221F48BC|nr:uncharacterized protein BC939DRAFT_252791 [Gamsiella multidivaricata]KAI7819589.1 hypothetical protein BC939DRAFT_252791 [Gamsiella multidivaricata]